MTTLVIGLPGTGKTTYCKEHLGNGLCYDLDAIASAFRLNEPHEEYHPASRDMANDLLTGFLYHARGYRLDLFIIRTAPSKEEICEIQPDKVVVCWTKHTDRRADNEEETTRRIRDAVNYCEMNGIEVECI